VLNRKEGEKMLTRLIVRPSNRKLREELWQLRRDLGGREVDWSS